MALDLDLTGSRAKIARAASHIKVMDGKIKRAWEKGGPFKLTTKVHPNMRESKTFLINNPEFDGATFGVIFGEIFYNLRCALDYTITELVKASDAQLLTKHQFPIYGDEELYGERVAPAAGTVVARGCLKGVRHGLDIIEQAQPFKAQPDAQQHTLWPLHQISNADKHRQILGTSTLPKSGEIGFVGLGNLRVLAKRQSDASWSWSLTRTDNKVEVLHIRTDRPMPPNSHARMGISAQMVFMMDEPPGREPKPVSESEIWAFNMSNARTSIEIVQSVVDQLAQL